MPHLMRADAIAKREQAEIVRSASDAAHVNPDLWMPDVARYLDPPADTAYPLEYCYYLLGDARGKVVLDYGCGDGLNTVVLARRGAQVTALDLSPDLIDVARLRLARNLRESDRSRVDFLVGSAHDVPLPDASADLVFGIAILHHLDLGLAAREVLRVLKPGGRAIFQEPIRNSGFVRAVRSAIPYRTLDVSPDERPLTAHELAFFARAFSHSRSKAFMLPTTNVLTIIPGLRRLLPFAYRWDAMLLRQFPALRYYASVNVMELWK